MRTSRKQDEPLICQQLVELVSDYLDGSLREQDREKVEAHLAVCDACTGYVEQVRRMLRLTKGLAIDTLPPERVSRLIDVFRANMER